MTCGEIVSRYEAIRELVDTGKGDLGGLARELDELADLAQEKRTGDCRFVADRARELASYIRTGFPPG